jgi:uncharacterized protein
MKRIKNISCLLLFVIFAVTAKAADDLPERPNPQRLVNDFTGTLQQGEIQQLEKKLVDFHNSTSTQIAVVITDDLKGYESSDFAIRLHEKWQIGQKGKDNGILILIKPSGSTGEHKAFISVGYGLEAVIPDATAKKIVEYEMIPQFKEGKFYAGLDAATSVLMKLALKEFTATDYLNKHKKNPLRAYWPVLAIVAIVILMSIMRTRRYAGSNNVPFLTAFFLMGMGSGSSGSGSFGNFSSGGGGFSGFGGGSTGGGGAGGSW